MAMLLSSRRILSRCLIARPSVAPCSNFCSEPLRSAEKQKEQRRPIIPNSHRGVQLPTLIPSSSDTLEGFNIELVDPDLWGVSFGVAQSRDGLAGTSQALPYREEVNEGNDNHIPLVDREFLDFDEIESLRIQKKLFYKLDKGSKEFDECNVSFYRKKHPKKGVEKKGSKKMEKSKPIAKPQPESAKSVKQKNKDLGTARERAKLHADNIGSREASLIEGKKARVPTFNQLTDPYHLPFCLDIYITKGSVRACIVHRVTSKVVAVAHSISKDLKFDLTSRKDSVTSAAVGRILAQRAIEDDIHNVVYTPRKGDKIEGKLQIVLQSIIDHGIDVKVKLKQKRPVKELTTYSYCCFFRARKPIYPDEARISWGSNGEIPGDEQENTAAWVAKISENRKRSEQYVGQSRGISLAYNNEIPPQLFHSNIWLLEPLLRG